MHAIRTRLLPELMRRGFENVPLPPPEVGPMDRELIVTQPFGMLRRPGPQGLELVEIQLAPRGRAAFRLNIGIVPYAGIEGIYGPIAPDKVPVGWLNGYYHLYRCPFLWTWFSVRRWAWRKPAQIDYDDLVERVVRLIPEVEMVLREGKQGPHVRFIKIDHPIEQIRMRLRGEG